MKNISKVLSKIDLLRLLVLISITALFSCTEEVDSLGTVIETTPDASFSAQADSSDWLIYNFINKSTNASVYSWDFGDNTTSEETEPTKAYEEGGSYDVTLIAKDALGHSSSTTVTVVVADPVVPVPSFNAVEASEESLTINFTNTSTDSTTYLWDFGDGNGTSTESDPVYTYAASGSYDVILTAFNSSGVSNTYTITVLVGPVDATFKAFLENADMQTYPTTENNNNDLVDAWTIDPDNNYNDGTDNPFNFWRNDDLEIWVSTAANTGGTTDKMSSSGVNAQSAGGASERSLKFDSGGERAYQPFEVETGVKYSISAYVKNTITAVGEVVGTFYILSGEPASEETGVLSGLALETHEVISTGEGNWDTASFDFKANSTFGFEESKISEYETDILTSTDQKFVIFYFVPNGASSDNNINLTDIEINTPGFN